MIENNDIYQKVELLYVKLERLGLILKKILTLQVSHVLFSNRTLHNISFGFLYYWTFLSLRFVRRIDNTFLRYKFRTSPILSDNKVSSLFKKGLLFRQQERNFVVRNTKTTLNVGNETHRKPYMATTKIYKDGFWNYINSSRSFTSLAATCSSQKAKIIPNKYTMKILEVSKAFFTLFP
mgnify:CR=1 FL=1